MDNETIFKALEYNIELGKKYKFYLYYATFRGRILTFKNQNEIKWCYKRKKDLLKQIKTWLSSVCADKSIQNIEDDELKKFLTIHEMHNQ